MALDEIGNLAPLPSLPVLMAEGGGTGITTMPVLQSLAQARNKWGDHAASTIWDASIVKIILGGASASTRSSGAVDIDRRTRRTLGHSQHRRLRTAVASAIDSPGRRSCLPRRIRTLPFGTGLVLLRSAPPIVAALRPWTSR